MKFSIQLSILALALFSCSKDETPPVTPNPGPNPNPIPTEFQALAGIFNGNGIGAAVNPTEDVLLLFNQAGDRYAWFEDNEIKSEMAINDPASIFANYQLNDIGAAVLFTNSTLYFFGTDGDEYQAVGIDVDDFEGRWNDAGLITFNQTVNALTEWGPDFTCPFPTIGAMWNRSNPGSTCFDQSVDHNDTWMVHGNGDEVVLYNSPSGGFFNPDEELENWLAENNCGGPDGLIPFEKISAACRYVLPNKIQNLFFSEDGTQFTFYNVSEGVFSPIYDLY